MTNRIHIPEVGPVSLGSNQVRLREPSPLDGLAWSRLRVDDADRLASRTEGLVPIDTARRWAAQNGTANWMNIQQTAQHRIERGLGFSWVIEVDSQFAGQLELTGLSQAPHHAARVGAWVGRRFASSGVASAALALALDYAFGSTDLELVEALIDSDNEHSRRGLISMGFRPTDEQQDLRSIWESHYQRDPAAELFEITRNDLPAGALSFVEHALRGISRRTRRTDDGVGEADSR
ncbi:ribosomal-protein-alanine N-acetyltransferase [Rhodococcus sp. OAS809]|uniref:GNAT family N-acetyltransferase n=1 Tax=Rhodococcus sp. OAS809 TaxID=2663874 RepID=UPI00178BA407